MLYKQQLSVFIFTLLTWLAIAEEQPVWSESKIKPAVQTNHDRELKDIPEFVLDYAPLVHLHSKEPFWPCDVNEHLEHVTPYVNDTKVDLNRRKTVDDLAELNGVDVQGGLWLYLKSDDEIDLWRDENIRDLPDWLTGERNIPVSPDDAGDVEVYGRKLRGDDQKSFKFGPRPPFPNCILPAGKSKCQSDQQVESQSQGGRSSAPAVLLVVEKEEGVIDAFWFFFYSYNLGNSVFSFRFGNHVGDWEHSVVRFQNRVPISMFSSQHAGGKGYTFEAMEKIGKRPVIYSASGTHAIYATPGIQDYVLPFRILHDTTARGPLWDPALNLYSYHYNSTLASGHDRSIRSSPFSQATRLYPNPDPLAQTLTPSALSPDAPLSWFYYRGRWGDEFYASSDHRQYQLGTEKAYVSGPVGPRFKALGRQEICPSAFGDCVLRDSIAQQSWALRIFIDYLCAVVIFWLLLGVLLGVMSCCGCSWRGRWGGKTGEEESEVEGEGERGLNGDEDLMVGPDGEREPTEEDPLLANDDLTLVRSRGLEGGA